ncbi:MAG TPA: Ig-like domain-containing protein [Cyclobacteriaceae bacterium]|nr:Ig-like domain-containing protein [Cyclobacteriaceae bacterium]
MKRTNTISLIKIISPMVWLAGFMAMLVSCDTLENDLQKPTANVTGTEVHARASNSTIIDLSSKIQTNQKVTLTITRQTTQGTLSSLGKGMLKYQPYKNTTRDSFGFTIYDEHNTILTEDSVVIIVVKDSTDLPCGIYPADDYLTLNSSDSSVTTTEARYINVLANDITCGYDSTEIEISIYQPGSGYFPPYQGTAEVENGLVKYTPNASFSGTDEIYYAIHIKNDTAISAIGVVHISEITNTCKFQLNNDYYSFSKDSIGYDSLMQRGIYLSVLSNDVLGCNNIQLPYSIVFNPHHGSATISGDLILYKPDSLYAGQFRTDSLRYQVCSDSICLQAMTIINIQN